MSQATSGPAPTADATTRARGGPLAGRRAVVRWSWRMFLREWRQQLLVLALIVVGVGGTLFGSAIAIESQPPANAGFGSAGYLASYPGDDPHLAAQLASLQRRFPPVQVIENQTISVPGSTLTFQLRAQDPHGPYGGPMLSLLAGRYPATASEVAVTSGVASDFGLHVGDRWRVAGVTRTVVGIVENPQSLLDEFALVLPGQVSRPNSVTALFDAHGIPAHKIGPNVTTPAMASQSTQQLSPKTVSLLVLTIGMLLIALMAIGGFTVIAQRRLRSLGMLESIGATDRQVGLVVRANGIFVGVVGALVGLALGFVAWLLYRPTLEQDAHHDIGVLQLPWSVVAAAVLLAIVAAYFAASRPARAMARIPVVQALTGRPPEPRKIRRSMTPGIVFLVLGFLLLGYSGAKNGNGSGGSLELVLGLVCLIPGIILLSPFFLTAFARLGRWAPVSARLALRDLSRYRARSGSALSAIAIGVMISVVVATAAAARYADVLDYAGPSVLSNQLILWNPTAGALGNGPGYPPTDRQVARWTEEAHQIARSLGATKTVAMWNPAVNVNYTGPGRQFNGSLYLATPQLLRAFGIPASSIDPNAQILSMRPGLSGVSGLQLQGCTRFGIGRIGTFNPGHKPTYQRALVCKDQTTVNNPVIQEVAALPSGVAAPNTVITERAARQLHLSPLGNSFPSWFIETPQPLTGAQIHSAQVAAAAVHMSVQTQDNVPTSATIIDWATFFGLALALCVLAMSVGLIRSETASDLRTLIANGASPRSRRTLTAVTATGLGFLGALLGTIAGYVGMIGWLRDNSLNGGLSSLENVPMRNLLVLLVGMPLVAGVVGWVLAWREPRAVAHQPIE